MKQLGLLSHLWLLQLILESFQQLCFDLNHFFDLEKKQIVDDLMWAILIWELTAVARLQGLI